MTMMNNNTQLINDKNRERERLKQELWIFKYYCEEVERGIDVGYLGLLFH
jgi:hypothetical protein